MTGPGHYQAAEEYLSILSSERDEQAWLEAVRTGEIAQALQAAQAHATLALTEAVIAGATMRPEDHDEWDRVTGRLS